MPYISGMKQIAIASLIACLATAPAVAADEDDGLSLMEQGARLFFEGIMQEMEPAIEEFKGLSDEMQPALRGLVENMGPALADLMDQVEDWSAYHPPEILPNGDIIMRRKAPSEMTAPKDGEIDI